MSKWVSKYPLNLGGYFPENKKKYYEFSELDPKKAFYQSIKKYNKFTNFTIFLVPNFLTSYYLIFDE